MPDPLINIVSFDISIPLFVPPAPMNLFSRLQYDVRITEILPGQKAEEAIQQNLPFYTEPSVPANNLTYRGMATDFEKDKWYAWQVVANDDDNYAGKSEVFVFKVTNSAPAQMIVQLSPYIKMKKNDPEKGIAPNGILKMSYVNETTDTAADIEITNLSGGNRGRQNFFILLKPGENLITYDVVKKLHLQAGNIYEAKLTNSRKEQWLLRFEIHDYNDRTVTHN